jgi:hypothetical protein
LRGDFEFPTSVGGPAGVGWPAAKPLRGNALEAAPAIAAKPLPILERNLRLSHHEASFILPCLGSRLRIGEVSPVINIFQ